MEKREQQIIMSNEPINTNKDWRWSDFFDHIYCIHYLPYKDRLEELVLELKRVGIYGEDIFSFKYTYPTKLDEYLYNAPNFSREYRNEWFKKPMLNLAIGHYSCMKEALALGYKRILIIEDDIAFLKDLKEIGRILKASPQCDIELYDKCGTERNWEVFKDQMPINDDYCGFALLWNASCYSLNTKGMEHIVKCQEQRFNVADFYTNTFSPVYDVNGNRKLLNSDECTRAVALKNIACQKPSKGETVTEHGETKWVYNQKGLSSCDLNPELYNL